MTWCSDEGPDNCRQCAHPIARHRPGGQCLDCDPKEHRICMQPVQSGKPYRFPRWITRL